MPSTSSISSGVASISRSIEPKCAASARAFTKPIPGMPSAYSTRLNGCRFERSIEPTRFSADLRWKPSSGSSRSTVRR